MPLSQQSASLLIVPGVYVDILPPLQALNPYINTSLNGFVGVANWGPVDTPVFCDTGASIIAAFGNDSIGATTSGGNYSVVEEALNALNEDGNSVLVRVTDGTDTAAVINLLDTATPIAATLVILTARHTGSYPMGNAATNTPAAGVRVDSIVTGQTYRVTIFFPGAAPSIYNNIVGGTGGVFNPTLFINNVIAAVNGTAQNSVPNPYFSASAGSGTHSPQLATVFAPQAGSGTDGTLGVTTSTLIGADSQTGQRTGIYALRGTGCFHYCVAGLTDLTQAATLSTFAGTEASIALAFITVPKGTSDSAAVGLRNTNAVVYSNVVIVKDFIQVYDSIQQTTRYVSPIGKAMGIIGLLAPAFSPINEPWNTTNLSAAGVLQTEQTPLGPRSLDELAYLLENGFLVITNQIPIDNGAYGLYDDVTSAGPGTNPGGMFIPVQRMNIFLADAFEGLGGQYVGQPQTTAPNDPLRAAVAATYNNFLSSLKPKGGTALIDTYQVTCDLTNNTPQTIAAGICYVRILVRYLGVVRIFYVQLQGGTNVTITSSPPSSVGS